MQNSRRKASVYAGYRRIAGPALYGRQEGAQLGYNAGKRGRPSHVLHTFWVGNLRMVLNVQGSSDKQHTSVHAKAAQCRLLDELDDKRPALVQGIRATATRASCWKLKSRAQPYLLRLRQTAKVQRLVAMQFARQDCAGPTSKAFKWWGTGRH